MTGARYFKPGPRMGWDFGTVKVWPLGDGEREYQYAIVKTPTGLVREPISGQPISTSHFLSLIAGDYWREVISPEEEAGLKVGEGL